MADAKRVSVRLLVDKEKKRVVFAESDKDFVDILFSFLTLPLGTIIHLLGKQSMLGSLDKLYTSVENLDAQNLQTDACRTMLLRPRSAAAALCEDLKINVDDLKSRDVHVCKKADCCTKSVCLGSPYKNVRCPHCQQLMDSVKTWPKNNNAQHGGDDRDGVFVKGGLTFLISDDLHVMPASMTDSFLLLDKLGISDVNALEERRKELGKEEIINLLRKSLKSNMPLTTMCFETDTAAECELEEWIQPKSEDATDTEQKKVSVKLLLSKTSNKVVFAEAGEDLVDLLLSFLTFPLGMVVKLLNKHSTIGCVDNLYMSAEHLSTQDCDCIKSDKCKSMLLSPMLSSFFRCDTNLLKIVEEPSRSGTLTGKCYTCYWEKQSSTCEMKTCKHGIKSSEFKELNPKRSDGSIEGGEGFVRGPGKFMVTDDMIIGPLSPLSAIQLIGKLEMPLATLVEKEVEIDEAQAVDLLKAVLVSQSALSHAFAPIKKRRVFSNF